MLVRIVFNHKCGFGVQEIYGIKNYVWHFLNWHWLIQARLHRLFRLQTDQPIHEWYIP